jgi:hypothetical protein
MEQHALFVCSRGILKSCFAHNAKPETGSTRLDDELLSRHRPRASIYVCTDAIPHFVESVLPRIEHPFVLVSGDSVLAASAKSLGKAFDALLSNDKLLAWFAQNCVESAPKLFPIPVGLDYQTMWERPGRFGLAPVSPIAQEHQLLRIWSESPSIGDRYVRAYCNWVHAIDKGDRRQCLEKLDRSICFLERNHIPRASTWARQSAFVFVVSPQGVGLDCHRTWEALALGCIPIVKRSPLSQLFADLPVLIVDDWSEVRRERLEACLRSFMDRKFDYSALFLDTWTRRIHEFPPAPMRMSYGDFRRWMTRWTG